jgi:long-chain acyl-CoA synthetase
MPIFHGFGLAISFHSTFSIGGHAIMLPTVSPKTFDETILKYKPNLIACVPSLLETLTNSKKMLDADLSFIKDVVVGGDMLTGKLQAELDEFLYDHGSEGHITPAFGLTECSAGCCMMPKECIKKESVGIPISDAIIKIVDPKTHKELPYGEVGEIVVNSPTVMKGYYNNPEETSKTLIKHEDGITYLHTGDLAYMDKDGFIFFQSRQKRMIVSSGYNIYPGQIEEIINKHKYVRACVAVGVPHPYKKEVVKVYIVLKDDIVLTSEVKKSIKTHCEKNIAKYALPYAYGYRKELPRTKIGKVAYRDLINSEDNEE